MTGILIRREKDTDTHKSPREDGGRDLNYSTASQEMHGATRS